MLAAVAAYDVAIADGGVPVHGVYAAALVLDLPVVEAVNALLASGWLTFRDVPVQGRKDPTYALVRVVSLRKA
jgi:hypothetical protein